MRYALVRFKGEPTESRPCGMNDIMGLSEYQNVGNAKRYLWDSLFQPRKYDGQVRGIDLLRVLAAHGYTHFGLYEEVPHNYAQPDKLVRVFENPYVNVFK